MPQGASSWPAPSSSWSANNCKNDNGYDFYYMATISTKVNFEIGSHKYVHLLLLGLPHLRLLLPSFHITKSELPHHIVRSAVLHLLMILMLTHPNFFNSILSQVRSPRTTQRQHCCLHCLSGSAPHQPQAEVKGKAKRVPIENASGGV